MKKLFLAAPLALAVGAMLSTPASAANFYDGRQIRAEINQLEREVDHARGLSRSEEARLERKVDQLQKLYHTYARNGLSRGELNVLNTRIDTIRNQLAKASHDWDRRDGHRDSHRDGYKRR